MLSLLSRHLLSTRWRNSQWVNKNQPDHSTGSLSSSFWQFVAGQVQAAMLYLPDCGSGFILQSLSPLCPFRSQRTEKQQLLIRSGVPGRKSGPQWQDVPSLKKSSNMLIRLQDENENKHTENFSSNTETKDKRMWVNSQDIELVECNLELTKCY